MRSQSARVHEPPKWPAALRPSPTDRQTSLQWSRGAVARWLLRGRFAQAAPRHSHRRSEVSTVDTWLIFAAGHCRHIGTGKKTRLPRSTGKKTPSRTRIRNLEHRHPPFSPSPKSQHGQDTRANRTRHTTSTSTQSVPPVFSNGTGTKIAAFGGTGTVPQRSTLTI